MKLIPLALWAVPDGSSELRVSSLALWLVPDGSSELRLSLLASLCVPDDSIKAELSSLDHGVYQNAEVKYGWVPCFLWTVIRWQQ